MEQDLGHIDLHGLLTSLAYPADQKVYAQADATLQNCLKLAGFLEQLQQIAADRSGSTPRDVRLLASLLTAREIPKKWRSKSFMTEEIKAAIRRRFFEFLDEPDLQIARAQLRLLVQVSRQDYPRIWPTLLQELMTPLQDSAAHLLGTANGSSSSDMSSGRQAHKVRLLNSLWTWNAFVKEWRSVRVPVGAQLMKDLVGNLRSPMLGYLETLMARDPSLEDWELLESARYAFKTCSRLLEWEFSRPKNAKIDSDPATAFALVPRSLEYLAKLQGFRLQLLDSPLFASTAKPEAQATTLLKSLTKYIRAIGKTYESLMHIDPKSFAAIDGTINAIGWWWGEVSTAVKAGHRPREDDDTQRYPKKFLLQGLILFKNVLPTLSAEHQHVFTDAFIVDAFHLIVDQLLPLSEDDWETWQADPEEWIVQEMDTGQAWSFDFRPCSERVLMALTSAARNRNVMEPLMVAKMQEVLTTQPRNDFASRVKWDTVLAGAGRMSRSLSSNALKLEQILPLLSPIALSNEGEDRILKYRLAWFIGQWVSSDEESAKLEGVWKILLRLLGGRDDGSDIAVNISAALAIKECVDLWELPIEYFEKYIGQIVEQMLRLIGEAESLSGKRTLLDVLSILIERVAALIMPYSGGISEAIPALWHGSTGLDGEWLFKASLVVLATKLVTAIGKATAGILHLIVPVIEESLANPIHLEEDGLLLWEATLANVDALDVHGGLAKLAPGLVILLGRDLDILQKALKLTESYLLLDGAWMLGTYGQQLAEALLSALNMVDKHNVKSVLRVVDLCTQVATSAAWGPALAHGLFQKVVDGLDDDKAAGTTLAGYLTTVARVILADPAVFLQLVQHVASVKGESPEKQLETTFDAMWRAFDYLSEGSSRKAIAMAVAALLPLGIPPVFERLDGEFVNIWLDVLGELKESTVEGVHGPELERHWKDDNPVVYIALQGTQELLRREALERSDPIYAQPLTTYVSSQLGAAQSSGIAPYWAKLDADVKRQLERILT